jgi:hypothetical protein
MAEVSVTKRVPIERERAWAVMSDLSRLDEWLELHEAWRSAVPSELETGTELISIVSFKGVRNRIAWTITEFRPAEVIALTGDGKGGTKAALRLSATPAGDETEIGLQIKFSNPALRGPLGRVMAGRLKGELEKSIDRFVELAG